MKLRNLNIYNKIMMVFIPVIILLATLVGFIMFTTLDSMILTQFKERGSEIAGRVASISADYILVSDVYALYEIVHEVKTNSDDVVYVIITNHKGQILAHTFEKEFPKAFLDANMYGNVKSDLYIEEVDSTDGILIDIIKPIESGKIGFVRIGVSEKNIREQVNARQREVFFITLAVCILASFIALGLTKMITDPIRKLVIFAQKISLGELHNRVEVKSYDEIGQLAIQFNDMADNLVKIRDDKDHLLKTLKEKESKRNILLNRLITAQEDERKRISRELHDETSQSLTALIVAMKLLENDELDQYQRDVFLEIRNTTVNILENVRNLAVELRPPLLDELGINAAMGKYITKYAENHNIAIEFYSNFKDVFLPDNITLALYRIMQEGLTNIVKHTKATKISVQMNKNNNNILLYIQDNGQGFTEEEIISAKKNNRIGIYGMQERAELFGGSFAIETSETGTILKVLIPITIEGI